MLHMLRKEQWSYWNYRVIAVCEQHLPKVSWHLRTAAQLKMQPCLYKDASGNWGREKKPGGKYSLSEHQLCFILQWPATFLIEWEGRLKEEYQEYFPEKGSIWDIHSTYTNDVGYDPCEFVICEPVPEVRNHHIVPPQETICNFDLATWS